MSPTDPAEILFPADSAGILFPAIPTEIPFPIGPDNDGTLSPTDPAGILFPAVLAEFPISMDPVGVLSPPDPADFDTVGVVDMAVVGEVLPDVPVVVDSLAVVAMVGVDAVQRVEGIPMDYGDDCDIPDPQNEFETVDGMPVYYGGDFNDSDCEHPHDLAYEDLVDWYNFNAPEGCCVSLPDDGEAWLPNTMCAPVIMVGEVAQPARLRQDSLDASVPVMDIGIMVPVGEIPMACDGASITAKSQNPGMSLRLWMGCPSIMEETLMIRIVRTQVILIMRWIGWTGMILTLFLG